MQILNLRSSTFYFHFFQVAASIKCAAFEFCSPSEGNTILQAAARLKCVRLNLCHSRRQRDTGQFSAIIKRGVANLFSGWPEVQRCLAPYIQQRHSYLCLSLPRKSPHSDLLTVSAHVFAEWICHSYTSSISRFLTRQVSFCIQRPCQTLSAGAGSHRFWLFRFCHLRL